MASGGNGNEDNSMKTITSRDKDDGSDSSSSDSSSLPVPGERASPSPSRNSRPADEVEIICNGSRSRDDLDQNPSTQVLFHPNEKGTKKQKRCDYDSDDRSYDGLGLEYKRRKLHTLCRRDTLLPDKTKMVDFDRQGTKTFGDRLLFETLQISEIDTLVGLTTSYDLDPEENKTFAKMKSLTDEAVFYDPQRHNPLLSATYDSPLPPSHIDYIKSRSLHQSFQPREEDQDRRKKNQKSSERKDMMSQFKDQAAVAMSMYLEECLTASLLPLAGLHVLRCRALESMASAESEFGATPLTSFVDNNDNGTQRRLRNGIRNDNNTAYDLQPTVIHPITGEHVKLDINRRIRWKEEDVFQEWTLPPEEAILKIMEQGILSNDVPYHFIPNAFRSWGSEHLKKKNSTNFHETDDFCSLGSSIDGGDGLNLASTKEYEVEQNMIFANKEIFDIFLPQKIEALAKNYRQRPT